MHRSGSGLSPQRQRGIARNNVYQDVWHHATGSQWVNEIVGYWRKYSSWNLVKIMLDDDLSPIRHRAINQPNADLPSVRRKRILIDKNSVEI